MPVLMSPDISSKFKEKWLSVYPEDHGTDDVYLDDSLTSLHWLQNFSILSADPERSNGLTGCPSSQQHLLYLKRLGYPCGGTDSPSSPPAGDTAATGMPLYLGSPVTSVSDTTTDPRHANYAQAGNGFSNIPVQTSPPVEIDYKTNTKIKPPYSYASLICMAMQASKQPKVTLSTIYNWITDNFCYYKHAEPSWQNSIRHNLSLNKCFMKVPRQKDEPGKGGFWQIDPQYADMFVNGIFKRRRMSTSHYSGNHRQSKPTAAQDTSYHGAQNGYSYQGSGVGSKRKHLSTKTQGGKATHVPKSPLLATDAHGADILRGDFDLSSVFDDVLDGSCSNFEDLDINTALSYLGCEMETSIQGRQLSAGHARWFGDGDFQSQDQGQPSAPQQQQQPFGYMELNSTPMEFHISMGDMPIHHHQLMQSLSHSMQLEEACTLLPEQAEHQGQHPWDEIKEEPQVIPLTLDQGFGMCEGFFAEIQPW